MYINPLTAIDFYKSDHRRQYPSGTTEVYSNLTARSSKFGLSNRVVFFGLQYFIKSFLIDTWNNNFFNMPKKIVINSYKNRMDNSLGAGVIETSHIEALHNLGYLPIKIKALPEGSIVPCGIPLLTIVNTHPEFFWLTNYIETSLSAHLWKPITSATTAFEFKKLLHAYASLTDSDVDFVKYQAHDFSFRGMSGIEDAAINGAAHLTSFVGTDTIPAIDLIEQYYDVSSSNCLIGTSIPATEHSVMCMGTEDGEFDTFKRLITETYPSGMISIVSDTWDFWRVLTDYLPRLKKEIMDRDGKVVIRPDSGDPVKIICGDPDAPIGSPQYDGAVKCLIKIFGYKSTLTGHKLMDSHIGLIYGDSITYDRAKLILSILHSLELAPGNIVFGIGSYTYQFVTRDNYSFAIKATSGVVNGKRIGISKSPKTDISREKISAYGLLRVDLCEENMILHEDQDQIQEEDGLLEVVFENGKLVRSVCFMSIREKLEF
jgi:nicotinamide phosphoribosyltransferase